MNTVKKFQKRVESFNCHNCGHAVAGDGFTNHCPQCLYSKHVDIFPGDRLEDCGGMMEVVEVRRKGDRYILTHQCKQCKSKSQDHFRDGDNINSLIAASRPKD